MVWRKFRICFLAACYQLDGSNQNPRAKYANAMIGKNAVRVICGYHDKAPQSGQNYDVAVAQHFIAKAKTGESVKSAWIQANQECGFNDYCVLTHAGNVQYSRFEGFPGKTYARPSATNKSILRFSSANSNGTGQPLKLNRKNLKEVLSGLQIPQYCIEASEAKISVKPDTATQVTEIGKFITIQNKEIGDQKTNLTEQQALFESVKWIDSAYNGVTWEEFKNGDVLINPITVAEVNLEGESNREQETKIAYAVSTNACVNGIPVEGDRYCTIVDDRGVISSAVSHRNYRIIPYKMSSENYIKSSVEANLIFNKVQLSEEEKEKTIDDARIVFADPDGDGTYVPTIKLDLSDGTCATVNCISNDIIINS